VNGRTIWKYEVEITDEVALQMPAGAEVLRHVEVNERHRSLWVWAIVNPSAHLALRTFFVCGTGNPMPPVGEHVGTVMDGLLVWHVFEAIA
jgi:hypothetical protein